MYNFNIEEWRERGRECVGSGRRERERERERDRKERRKLSGQESLANQPWHGDQEEGSVLVGVCLTRCL